MQCEIQSGYFEHASSFIDQRILALAWRQPGNVNVNETIADLLKMGAYVQKASVLLMFITHCLLSVVLTKKYLVGMRISP